MSRHLKQQLDLADARGRRFSIEQRLKEIGPASLVRPVERTPGPRDLAPTRRTP